MNIGEICNRDVIIARCSATVVGTAQLMREENVGSVVIVNDDLRAPKPVGIITDRDLVVGSIANRVQLDHLTVADVMTHDPLVAREDQGVWETIQGMRREGVRRVPVVAEDGALVGILSMNDLLQILVAELSELVPLVTRSKVNGRLAWGGSSG
ncbi:MAG: CBS domain-containing protein [Gammaproteobacteria bacterium]|nr:MAG: CBS domain-containing protein [Gammaproteobacteria bacterium]